MSELNKDSDAFVLGQKYAFATASLIMGIASYVNLLGMEKAAVALLFAWMALRRKPLPALAEHQGWAKTGMALGAGLLLLIPALVIWKRDRLLDLIMRLQDLKR
jgi:hypothetical protein